MNEPRLELRAADIYYDDSVRIALIARDRDGGRVGYGAPMTIVPTKDGEPAKEFVAIDRHVARKLMDDLWSIGIRPTEFKSTNAAATSSAAHLADMRAIAFAKLEIAKP